uniref:Uncharacterized protein n=1 Tax=Oryza nivara TaxID=4536 RepID=A0A0E0G1Z2_ORYNI
MEAKNQGKEEEEKQYRKDVLWTRIELRDREEEKNTGRQEHAPLNLTAREEEKRNTGRQERAPPKGTSSREEEEVNAGRQEHSAATGTHREEEEANTGRQEHAAAATTGHQPQPEPGLHPPERGGNTYFRRPGVSGGGDWRSKPEGQTTSRTWDGFSRRRDEEMDWRHSHRGEGIANPTESPTADMPPGSYAFLILCRASIFTCGSIGLTRRLLVSANSLP